MKKITDLNDSTQPATRGDISELIEIMNEGITYLSNGQESLKEEMGGVKSRLGNVENRLGSVENRLEDVEKRLEKVEVQVSDTNRRLLDVEFDTPTRKDFQKLKQRVDRYIPASA